MSKSAQKWFKGILIAVIAGLIILTIEYSFFKNHKNSRYFDKGVGSTKIERNEKQNESNRNELTQPANQLPKNNKKDSLVLFKILVDVNSDRSKAKLYIDEDFYGTVPDSFTFEKGLHVLKLEHKDPYGDTWVYRDTICIANNRSILINSNSWIKK